VSGNVDWHQATAFHLTTPFSPNLPDRINGNPL
jgi:hypothetical protein